MQLDFELKRRFYDVYVFILITVMINLDSYCVFDKVSFNTNVIKCVRL